MAKCTSCSFPLEGLEERIFCPSCGAMIDKFAPPSKERREPSMDKGKTKKAKPRTKTKTGTKATKKAKKN